MLQHRLTSDWPHSSFSVKSCNRQGSMSGTWTFQSCWNQQQWHNDTAASIRRTSVELQKKNCAEEKLLYFNGHLQQQVTALTPRPFECFQCNLCSPGARSWFPWQSKFKIVYTLYSESKDWWRAACFNGGDGSSCSIPSHSCHDLLLNIQNIHNRTLNFAYLAAKWPGPGAVEVLGVLDGRQCRTGQGSMADRVWQGTRITL